MLPPLGIEPMTLRCRDTTLPTRVWAISEKILHWGGIGVWSSLVFMHYWVLLKKLIILSIDT